MKRWQMLTFVAVIVVTRVAGADECKVGDRIQDCFVGSIGKQPAVAASSVRVLQPAADIGSVRVLNANSQPMRNYTTAAIDEKLALENTGGQSMADGQGTSSSDFANDLIALLESSGAGTRVGDTFTVHLGFPLAAASDKKNLRLSLALKDPKLDTAVAGLLSGKDLEDAKNSIGQSDRDLTFAVAWSLRPRSLEPVVAAAKKKLAQERNERKTLAAADGRIADGGSQSEMVGRIVSLAVEQDAADFRSRRALEFPSDSSTSDSSTVTTENRAAVVNAVLSARAEERRLRGTWIERRVDGTAKLAADAADEQSQFWGEARYNYRDPLIGAKEVKVSFTYELPSSKDATVRFQNLLLADAGPAFNEALKTASDASGSTPAAKPRFSFTGSYDQLQGRSFTLPALSKLNKQKHVLSLSAVAGWKIPTLSKDRDAKLDFNGTFENDSSDPKKKNRLIASLAFTQKLSDKFTLPLTLVYASHSNDLDVNRRFSAHFGISYKIPPGNASAKKAELMAALAAEE